jgi:Dyp-type peroxidase family
MQRELIMKGNSLGVTSDLTLMAQIKPGFIDSLESMTYKTRVKRVLTALHGARQSAHEYATARLLSDAVERVGVIHSVRVVVMEPEGKVLLSVSFDGPWEAYIRVLWDKVGALLDLIFCNTIDYPISWESSFEQWAGWAHKVQRETGFFYGPPETTAADVLYDRRLLVMRERHAVCPHGRLDELRAVLPPAEEVVDRVASSAPSGAHDDPPLEKVDMFRMGAERLRQHLQGLAGLYRLTDLYVPGTADGPVLHRAAIELLREFSLLWRGHAMDDDIRQQRERERFDRAIDWLCPDGKMPELVRPRPPLPATSQVDPSVRAEVQGGILRAYEAVTHGALLLLHFESPAAAAGFIDALLPDLTRDTANHVALPGTVYRNIAFTVAGLRACGMDEDTVALLPEEFLQGMARRAGMLGDVRHNHPRRWRLPRRFRGLQDAGASDTVDLGAVHAVIQLRCLAAAGGMNADELSQANHPLRDEVERLCALAAGTRLLAVQGMRRRFIERDGIPVTMEHFGFADGGGQPDIEWNDPRTRKANRVQLGEVLWGHANSADEAPSDKDPRAPWLVNGSFLVVRKYRQFVDRLHAAVMRTANDMRRELGGTEAGHVETVYAKLMGRRRDGVPLVPAEPGDLNDFDFDGDRQGQQCPLHAHIRRANPRPDSLGSGRLPRIVRRGMSYGPAVNAGHDADRGLVFMAYNQSLGEQFEVVQRWLMGGNSTGSTSATSCPIVGVPQNGYPRVFRFELANASGRAHTFLVELEDSTPLFEEPAVPTQLEWGLYLFAPSISALQRLRALPSAPRSACPYGTPWESVAEMAMARERIRALQAMPDGDAAIEAWKAVVEDPDAIDRQQSAALWAVIRRDHGGVLNTPYGTLVADRDLVLQALSDGRYSVCGQRRRMLNSFGDIYLGLDAGADYAAQSHEMNKAIGALPFEAVFACSRDAAAKKIDAIVRLAKKSLKVGEKRFETMFDAREVMDEVLAELTEAWFGLQDNSKDILARRGTDWGWRQGDPPLYPGHFTALSRNMFQPHPGPVPSDLGSRYGKALHSAMKAFVERHVSSNSVPKVPNSSEPAPLSVAAFGELGRGRDADFVGRLINGVVMGYTPTIIGAVLNVLLEWRRNDRFGTLRSTLAGRTDVQTARTVLDAAMREAACMRPMPQITWRTVLERHDLESRNGEQVSLAVNDKVVLALVSGTQQSLADGAPTGRLMFGGDRSHEGHPLHACPGFEAGVAAMLGSLVAILSRAESLREGPSPLAYSLEGPADVILPASTRPTLHVLRAPVTPMLEELVPRARLESFQLHAGLAHSSVQLPSGRTGLIMAWGDSWVAYELGPLLPFGTDLRDSLASFGYAIPPTFCHHTDWGTVQAMAENPKLFCEALDKAIKPHQRPRAVLISAGGNDSTRSKLANLLNRKETRLPVLDEARAEAHVTRLRGYFVTVLTAIQSILVGAAADIPVLVHGYDHPFPAGQGPWPVQHEWLHDVFADAGYAVGREDPDLPACADAMRQLIDKLNVMLAGLPAQFPHMKMKHVDLRRTIASQFASAIEGWHDDLHPENTMFKLMAAKIDAAIQH